MKLLMTSVALFLSLSFVEGMGCKSKDIPEKEVKVLPESTKASAPASELKSVPIKLIENTAEDNKKVDEKLNELPAKAEPVTPLQKVNKPKSKKKGKVQRKGGIKAKKSKKKS